MFHFRRKAFHHQGAKTQGILGTLVVDSKRTNSSFTNMVWPDRAAAFARQIENPLSCQNHRFKLEKRHPRFQSIVVVDRLVTLIMGSHKKKEQLKCSIGGKAGVRRQYRT
jgi:hypothetical protein